MAIAIQGRGLLLASLLLVACQSDQMGPRATTMPAAFPSSQVAQIGSPGAAATIVPAVKVELNGRPVPNVDVTFTVTRGGGAVAKRVVRTDAHGLADCGAWTLGPELGGTNEVVASIEGAPPVSFSALAFALPAGAEAYDLVSENGYRLPAHGFWLGQWEVVAGRLVLSATSTYTATIVEFNSTTREFEVATYDGPYSRSGSQLALTNYDGAPVATGVFQIDLLAVHVEFDPLLFGSDDTAPPPPQDDVYRRVI